jgi:hypothetical protein
MRRHRVRLGRGLDCLDHSRRIGAEGQAAVRDGGDLHVAKPGPAKARDLRPGLGRRGEGKLLGDKRGGRNGRYWQRQVSTRMQGSQLGAPFELAELPSSAADHT